MRHKSELIVILAVAAFALAGGVATLVLRAERHQGLRPMVHTTIDPGVPAVEGDGAAWFTGFRGYCNPVEVESRLRWQPAPSTEDGAMYEAACLALAGRIDLARAAIDRLPPDRRYQAAGIVFNVGHPAADAGDDVAAGPLMELVVEYWPNHYMALYHAGAAAFEREELSKAYTYLETFLQEYQVEDGWRSNARSMIDFITRIER